MPRSPVRVLSFLPVLVLLLAVAAFAAPRRTAPKPAGDTVDVEIKIIPFYAVDAEGKPVWDLQSNEVELRVGGKPVFIDTFDAPAAPGGAERNGSNGLRPASRHVVFLIDSAFTSPAGLRNSIQVARKLVEEVPAGDRLSLLTHSVARGMEKTLGPLPADRSGKARFLGALSKLLPEVRRLNVDPGADMPPVMLVERREGVPPSQWSWQGDSMRESGRSEYMAVARELAGSLDATAAELRRQQGAKLFLVFWQGLDPELYFTGDMGRSFVGEGYAVGKQRTSGLLLPFKGPLQALGDSGTMTVFVNASNPEDVGSDADSAIRQIAQTAGAAYTGGGDTKKVEEQVAATTAAYYEAGFYLKSEPAAGREPVEVVVKRPGVRAWAPSAVRLRETYASMSAYEKQLFVVGLVANGPQAQRGPVKLVYQELGGKVASRPEAKGGRRLRYDPAWPDGLKAKELDLYNVVLVPSANGGKMPKILQLDHRDGAHPGAVPMEINMPKEDKLIWGIVAVEPSTGHAWIRRLQLAGERVSR
jgi:hypothetical protein